MRDTRAQPHPRSLPGAQALGIDVGGTKIAGGIVDLATGAVTARRQVATDPRRGGAAVLADVTAMARDLAQTAADPGPGPQALGLGVAELVSPAGEVFSDYRIAWRGLDVQGALSAILPTRVTSDVRAAALAEARLGAGRDLDHLIFVTIGTGVSGVLVQHGQPYAGSRGAALVIANGPNRHHCPACGHLAGAMVEDIAGGPGLAAAGGCATAEAVLAAAHRGEARALAAIGHATQELGRVLALLADALDPQAIVIGGGLGSAPGAYIDSLRAAIHAGLWDGGQRVLPILQARFGPDAGIIGAALHSITQEPALRPIATT